MVVCPSCGQENPEGFRLCGMCGAVLAEPPPRAEERKLVSVLFVDLVGFTAVSNAADPEDVRARLRPYHALLRREIERFGGRLEKFVGDAAMAVFGAPLAHEDDAERGVRAALRILDAVEDLNAEQPEIALSVRAAVATGEALVSLGARPETGEAFVAGDVVNTASRMQGLAPAGGVVVGETTYRATRGAIEYEELEPATVKGKPEPIRLWHAVRARSRFGVDVEPAGRTPFVGRQDDLDLLRRTYARAVRESAVQLVTVVGEPGVGKTRLVTEFRRWLDDSPELVYWRQGRCLPYGDGITFWALGEIVKAHAGILESDTRDAAAEKLETAVASLAAKATERDWLIGKLSPLVGAEGAAAGEREESFTAWRRFFDLLAAQRPLVVFVEDLHWADRALLDFLEHLVDWATGVPLLVLCTARPELYERHPGWGGGKRNSATIALSPLSGDDTARLVAALLGQAVLPAETQAALLERAGGNPLYAEEFVRMLSDRGLLVRNGGHLADVPVPETLQALVAARLDTLPAERKAILHDASVVGKVFWPGAVAAVAGNGMSDLGVLLRELVRKELVRPARTSSIEGEDEFSFWHALVRDVTYAQIPRAARARKHRAAAEWLERVAGERVSDHAELLAEHYRQALELSRASGEDEGDLPQRTARFLVLAGERALALDLAQAARSFRAALELLPAKTPLRATALEELADAENRRGDLVAAVAAGDEAIELYERLGDAEGAVRSIFTVSSAAHYLGNPKHRVELLARADALLRSIPEGPLNVRAWIRKAGAAMFAGRPQESFEWADRVLAARENADAEDIASALSLRGTARCDLGDEGGLDDLEAAISYALDRGLARAAAISYVNYGDGLWMLRGPRAALENHVAAKAFADERGLGQSGWLWAEMMWFLYDLGEWDRVLRESEQAGEGRRGTWGRSHVAIMFASHRALVLAQRGRVPEAEPLIEETLDPAREIGDPQVLVPVLAAAAVSSFRADRIDRAVEYVVEIDGVTKGRPPMHRSRFLADEMRILLAARRLDLAEARLEAGGEGPRSQYSIVSARAGLSEARGELELAESRFAEAARSWAEYEHMLETGHAHYGRGRCLAALRRKEEAASELAAAREIFARLRAAPLLAELDGLESEGAAGPG